GPHREDPPLDLLFDSVGAVVGGTTPFGQPRRAAFLVSSQPLVADATADLEPPAQLRHRVLAFNTRHHKTQSLIGHTGLLPGHGRRSFRPGIIADRYPCPRSEVLPMYPVRTGPDVF